jgi:hypothetical protein
MENCINSEIFPNKKFREELLSFDAPWTVEKAIPSTIPHCSGNMFMDPLPSIDRGIHRPTDSPLI